MATGKTITVIILVIVFLLLGLLDLGLNVISLIPGIGDVVETFSEAILELLQAVTFAIALIIVGKK